MLCTYQLKPRPPPPQPQAYVGQCGGFLWYLKAWLGISQDLLSIFMEVGERGGDLTHA